MLGIDQVRPNGSHDLKTSANYGIFEHSQHLKSCRMIDIRVKVALIALLPVLGEIFGNTESVWCT